MDKAPIIGFVRYSQKIKFGHGEKERDVFEPNYFEYRFNIFKNITLKSFQEQNNNNFILLLLHSKNMPQKYKNKFKELEDTNAFLRNLFMEDTEKGFHESLAESIEYVSFEKNVAVTFRIDNDDAVPNDFIQRLSTFLKEDFCNYSISMPNICIIKHISENLYMVQEHYFPSNSIGLAYVTNKENYKTIMELGDHGLVNRETPMILICGNGGLQTINGENAANTISTWNSKKYGNQDIEKYLISKNFRSIDIKQLHILPHKISLKDILILLGKKLILKK